MSADSIGTSVQKPKNKRALPPDIASAATIVKLVGSCVYFLLDKEAVVYIGSSKGGSKRIAGHIGRISFDSAAFLPVDEAERYAVERRYIQQLNPKHNTQYTPRNKKRRRGPNPCPLTRHKTGQWYKKHKGRHYYFGSRLHIAMERYRDEWWRIVTGRSRYGPLPLGVLDTPVLT